MKLIITDIEDFHLPVKGPHKIIKPQTDIRHESHIGRAF